MKTTIGPGGIAPLREHRGGRHEPQQFRDECEQLRTYPLQGHIFPTLIISSPLPDISFWIFGGHEAREDRSTRLIASDLTNDWSHAVHPRQVPLSGFGEHALHVHA